MLNKRRNLNAFWFVLPALIMLIVFVYFPLVENILYSFSSFTLSTSGNKKFIGLANYEQLIADSIIGQSLKNNVLYAVISVIWQVLFAMVLAAVLEDQTFRKAAPVFRTVYFLPMLLSMTVVCLIFKFIYNPQMGLLNGFLNLLHLDKLTHVWLGKKETAMYSIIAVSQWQSLGYTTMLFIVAIQKIPEDLYEAAIVDGAGKVRRFVSITVPMVRQMFFVNMVITVAGAFTVFNEPYILTGGGPGTATMVLALHMYQTGFVKNQMGYASAIAILIFIITAVLSSLQFVSFGQDKGEI